MKKIGFKIIGAVAISALLLFSCVKEGDNVEVITPPSVVLAPPIIELSLSSSDPVLVGFTIEQVSITVDQTTYIATNSSTSGQFTMEMTPADLTGMELVVEVQVKEVAAENPRTRIYTRLFEGMNLVDGEVTQLSDDFSLWSVTTSASSELSVLVEKIAMLEQLAADFQLATPITGTYLNKEAWLVAMYVRQFNSGYTSSSWTIFAGAINTPFVTYVQTQNPELHTYFQTNPMIAGDEMGEKIDLYHMCATLSGYVKSTGTTNDIIGWGGDLLTLIARDIYPRIPTTSTEEEFYAKTLEQMGGSWTTFNMPDLLSDADAVNLRRMVKDESITLSEAFKRYYNYPSGYLRRYSSYAGTDYATFLTAVKGYTKNSLFNNQIMGSGVTLNANHNNGIARGYCEFILRLMDKELATTVPRQ